MPDPARDAGIKMDIQVRISSYKPSRKPLSLPSFIVIPESSAFRIPLRSGIQARDFHRESRPEQQSQPAYCGLSLDSPPASQSIGAGWPASLIEHRGGLAAKDVPARQSAAFRPVCRSGSAGRHAGVRE